MVTNFVPPHKLKESSQVYVSKDKPKYPDFLKKIFNWAAGPSPSGDYKTYAVYECPDDKLLEAMKALIARYNYYASVEGYKFFIEPLVDFEEAFKLLLKK